MRENDLVLGRQGSNRRRHFGGRLEHVLDSETLATALEGVPADSYDDAVIESAGRRVRAGREGAEGGAGDKQHPAARIVGMERFCGRGRGSRMQIQTDTVTSFRAGFVPARTAWKGIFSLLVHRSICCA